MTTLLKDDRDIRGLTLASGKEYSLGCGVVNRIEAYKEDGQMDYVPWFMVQAFGGWVIARVNSAHVEEVRYE